jgi:hypothetical protein
MTQEQLASARLTVAGLLQSQRTQEHVPGSVDVAIDNELGYLASASVDPIPDDEFDELVGNITRNHLAAGREPSNIIDNLAPSSTIIDGPVGSGFALYPDPDNPTPVSAVDIVESVTITPELAAGHVVFDPAGFEAFCLTLLAAVEALNGLAMALDAMLTPGPGYEWEDAGIDSAMLHYDPLAGAPDKLFRFVDMPAEVHRSEDGGYAVTVHFGTGNPAGDIVAVVRDMPTAKYVAAGAVRSWLSLQAAQAEAVDPSAANSANGG